MIVLPQPAEAAALTGRHSAGDEIGSTRGFRADRSAEGTDSETDGSTGCRFGLKSASASWRALERRRALALRARSLTSNNASRSVAERARWSFVLQVLRESESSNPRALFLGSAPHAGVSASPLGTRDYDINGATPRNGDRRAAYANREQESRGRMVRPFRRDRHLCHLRRHEVTP